jgi:hypothetical protein
MNEINYSKIVKWLIGVWFLLAIAMSALHLLWTVPNAPPIALGLSALTPLFLFGIWFAASSGFRKFALGLDRSVLTMVQTWRVEGFVFLVLYTYKILPASFALPAGLGDMTIGATAYWAATRLSNRSHRSSFIAWQVLGMIDLISAIGLGATAGLRDPGGISTGVMTALPMSLIPTFGVPLLMMLHILCIAQSVQKSEGTRLLFGRSSPANA